MADYCHAKFDCTFCVDFIEQSGEFCDRYRKRIESGAYSASVFHSLFETAPVESAAYDLVFLIHSIFAFESRDAVRKVLSLPRAGGRIVVVSNDESSFLGGLKRILDVDFDDRRYEINELEETLRAAGVGYERRRVLTRWAVSEADWQVRMDVMLEWLSLGAYGSLAASAKHDVETYVMANSQPLEGRRIFCEEEVVLIIGPTVAQ
jgi:hypothetical protein